MEEAEGGVDGFRSQVRSWLQATEPERETIRDMARGMLETCPYLYSGALGQLMDEASELRGRLEKRLEEIRAGNPTRALRKRRGATAGTGEGGEMEVDPEEDVGSFELVEFPFFTRKPKEQSYLELIMREAQNARVIREFLEAVKASARNILDPNLDDRSNRKVLLKKGLKFKDCPPPSWIPGDTHGDVVPLAIYGGEILYPNEVLLNGYEVEAAIIGLGKITARVIDGTALDDAERSTDAQRARNRALGSAHLFNHGCQTAANCEILKAEIRRNDSEWMEFSYIGIRQDTLAGLIRESAAGAPPVELTVNYQSDYVRTREGWGKQFREEDFDLCRCAYCKEMRTIDPTHKLYMHKAKKIPGDTFDAPPVAPGDTVDAPKKTSRVKAVAAVRRP